MTAKTGDITTTLLKQIGAQLRPPRLTAVSTVVGPDDQDIFVNGQAGPVTITLPAGVIGRLVRVFDGGLAGTFAITMDGNGSSVNGLTAQVISTPYGSMILEYNGTGWSASIPGTSSPASLPVDVLIYADSVTGSDTNPGTQALPVKTLSAGMALVPPTATGKRRVRLIGAGPYLAPTVITGAFATGSSSSPAIIVGDALTAMLSGIVSTITSGQITNNVLTPTVAPPGTTIAVGSNGAVLPQAIINVASVVGIPNTNQLLVTTSAGVQNVTYTGTAPGQFTGCSGGTGTMSTGGAVTASFRGLSIRMTSGAKNGFNFPIALNSAVALSTLFAMTGVLPLDTFDIFKCTTEITIANGRWVGPGLIGVCNCKISGGALDLVDGIVVMLDNCEYNETVNRLSVRQKSRLICDSFASGIDQGFLNVTDVGTQLGRSAIFLHAVFFASACIRTLDEGSFIGNVVSLNGQLTSGSIGNQQGGGSLIVNCLDIDLSATLTTQPSVAIDGGGASDLLGQYCRIVGGGGGAATGVSVFDDAYASILGAVITNCPGGAVFVSLCGTATVQSCSGSTGNLVGILVQSGGQAKVSGNTLTGTNGDVQIDSRTAITHAAAGPLIRSSAGLPGTRVCFGGGMTSIVGPLVVYLPVGGIPGAVNGVNNSLSATGIGYQMFPGGLAQKLGWNIKTNAWAGSTTARVFKAPAATGVPASTGIFITVLATVTGRFTELVPATVTFNDGDQIDLQLSGTSVAGLALTCTAAVQVQ